MPLNVNDLTDGDITSHVEGSNPIMGNDAPIGFYQGKRLGMFARDYCNLTRWIRENSPWFVTVVMEFTDENSQLLVRVRRQSDNQVIRTVGPLVMRGGATRTGGFADRHEALGTAAIFKIAKKIEETLIADGVLV